MSEQTMTLRERAARAHYAVDPYVDHTGAERPWDELWPDQLESVYSRVDPVLAVIAAQPRPEMAEIREQIDHLMELAAGTEFDRIYTLIDSDCNPRRQKSRDLQRDIVLDLFERALAVPAGMVLVPVAEIERILAKLDANTANPWVALENEADTSDWLRALLPGATS